MTYHTPCADPDNDPNDWFISKDGKQYPDDELVTEAEVRAFLEDDNQHLSPEDAREELESQELKDALRRRRHAVDACFTCYYRTYCLDKALKDPALKHGTWGGYTEEQIRELRKEIARRKKKRDADGTQE